MHDINKIKISEHLSMNTINKAEKALCKIRVGIVSGVVIAAVACVCLILALPLGAAPVQDVVVQNGDMQGQSLYQSTESINEFLALNYARSRHIKVYPLANIGSGSITIDFDETPTFITQLSGNSVIASLAQYGFSVNSLNNEVKEHYSYYMVVFEAPYYPLRYIDVSTEFQDNTLLFKYTCLDLGLDIMKNDLFTNASIPKETKTGFLIVMPSSSNDININAEYVRWSGLPEEKKVSTLIKTVFAHEDLEEVLIQGVENSLSFELAVLHEYLDIAVAYLKEYNFTLNTQANRDVNEATVITDILYNLLNDYQLENYDLADPVQAIKKELLLQAIANEEKVPNCLIIPEVKVFVPEYEGDSLNIYGYTSVFSFKPSLAPAQNHQAIYVLLKKKTMKSGK